MKATPADSGAQVPLPVDSTTGAGPVGGGPFGRRSWNLSLTLTWLYAALVRIHPLLLIAAVAWIANFLHFESFGYYEDDWYYFPTGLTHPLLGRLKAILPLMKSLFQGRPMLLFFETLFPSVGRACSSMVAPYVLVFGLFATTAFLFYRVLRMRFPRLFCTIAALLFVLSPLTTVRQNLVIGCIMGPAFICVLTAVWLRRRQPVVSYLLAIVALLTYESVFLLFLAAPLFEPGRFRRKKIWAVAVHLCVCALIVVGFVVLRRAVGEQRVVEASAVGPTALIGRVLALDLYYSAQSFMTYLYAGRVAWRAGSLEPLIYLPAFSVWAFVVLLRSHSRLEGATGGRRRLRRVRQIWWLRNGCALSLGLILLGFLAVYFQTSGNRIELTGRDTRFSVSAVPGSSMFVASLTMLAYLTLWRRFRGVAWVLLSVLLSVLFVYSFVVQDDYVRAWDYEKTFLSQVVLLTPDLEPDGLIVVRTGAGTLPGFGPQDRTASIGWQPFGTLVSLKCLGDWSSPPEIILVGSDAWKDRLAFGPDGRLHWTQRDSGSTAEFVVPGRVVVLNERADGLLTRSEETVTVDGKPITRLESSVNIALGKPARQSSTFGSSYAARGVDGHVASGHSAWNTINASQLLESFVSPPARTALTAVAARPGQYAGFHTNYEQNAWWEVDLGRSFALQQVRVYNGQPAFFQRAASLRLQLSDDGVRWRLAYDNRGRVFGPEPLSIDLADVRARYVRIQLAEPNWLHLEQVEVFGR